MYHIPNDKRARQSSELIFDGLLRCMQRKAFDSISISDLQRESGVARSTFYRLFDHPSDVLYWKCDVCFREVLSPDAQEAWGNELAFAEHYFAYWLKHSEILELLLDIHRPDVIYACHMKNAEALQESCGKLEGINERNGRYFMAIRTGFTISILTVWLKGGKKETLEEILQIIREQLVRLSQNARQPL